jgi:Domain of unknown function (DUF4265)
MSYGLALGDVVRLGHDGKIAALVRARGHRVLRLLLADNPDSARVARDVAEITACVARAALLSEWHGPRFAAIDIPPGEHPENVYTVLGRIIDEGRGHWEWAGSRQFATPRQEA